MHVVGPELDGDLPRAQIAATAYFVAAEAVTNAAKHAVANRGAHPGSGAPATGCFGSPGSPTTGSVAPTRIAAPAWAGLRDRVEALDGRLRVVSPSEGGTSVIAEMPCAPAA